MDTWDPNIKFSEYFSLIRIDFGSVKYNPIYELRIHAIYRRLLRDLKGNFEN